MEMLKTNEKRLHAKEKGNIEMSQTNEKGSVELSNLHVTSPVIMTIHSSSICDNGKSVLVANLAAYIGERYFDVLLVDLGIEYANTPSQLHGVELSQDEFGVLETWLAYDTYVVILPASGDAPVVKPSAKAKGVYVAPPGNVTAEELITAKVDNKAIARLRSLIVRQAEKYRTPLVIINPPPSSYISDLILSISDMAAVIPMSSLAETSRELEVIMKRVGGYLSNMNAVFIVTMDDARSVGERINTSFPVYRLPFSPEVNVYSRHNLIFITAEPKTDSGRRWRAEFVRLAEAVVEKAREILRNKAIEKPDESND